MALTTPAPAPATPAPAADAAGFAPGTRVVVEQVDAVNWRVLEPITYRGQRDVWTVPAGAGTDFASVPRVFVWLVPSYGKYTAAAILHDHLWREVVPAGTLSRLDADGLFRQAMRQLGVPFAQRWLMWAAVRWNALTHADGRAGWLREAPRVLAVTALALPVVLPPAAAVAVGLVAAQVVEAAWYVPLRLGRWLQGRLARRAKRVNQPGLGWRV